MDSQKRVVEWVGGSAVVDVYHGATLVEAWMHFKAGRGRYTGPVRVRYEPTRIGAAWAFYMVG